jgi:hypothetical protein
MRVGMSGVLLHRGSGDHPGEAISAARGVRVIRSLRELPAGSSGVDGDNRVIW